MSNDSNEPGNDTAAAPAFQVGDTVSFVLSGEPINGHVYEVSGDIATIDSADGFIYHRPIASLTLISRAPAPAPAPEQTSRYCVTCCDELTEYERNLGLVYCHDCIAEPEPDYTESEPPTPAPAATPPTLDTHTLELPVEVVCPECGGSGYANAGECSYCNGQPITWTMRLSGEALDRLVGELAKRLPGADTNAPALLQAIEGPLNMEQLGDSISLAWHAIQNAQSLTTDQTESEVLDALDKIGDSLHDLFIAMRALLTLTASQYG